MLKITTTEFKKNFDKYLKLGQKEKIMVFHNGEHIFIVVPKNIELFERLESYFGILPEDALEKLNNKEIDREN